MTGGAGAFGNFGGLGLPAMPVPFAGEVEVVRPDFGAGDVALISGYDAVSSNPMRAPVFWPELDTRYEFGEWDREEMLRSIRWLYANSGIFKGFINNGAALVGFHRPQSANDDADFVDAVQEVIDERMGTPELFDLGGQYDVEDCQTMLTGLALKDADALVVNTRGKDGGAMFAFYEAHQLCNPPNSSSNWRDGVRYEGSRKVAYGLRDEKTGKVTVVEARHVFYYGEPSSPGYGRAVPPLAHAVNDGIDIMETRGFVKGQLKTAALFGAVIQTQAQSTPLSKQGLGGAKGEGTNAATGDKFETSRVWNPGQIPELPPGKELKLLLDDRPSQNSREFERDLVRSIAVGYGLPPEVVWQMIDLTGPGVRFVMDVADRWIKGRGKPQRRTLERMVRRTLACEIEAGRLKISKEDPRWWRLHLVPQRSLTIDRGKESRARLDELDAGVGTLAGWEEISGIGWKKNGTQALTERAWLKVEAARIGEKFGVPLTAEEVFRPRAGAAAVAKSVEDGAESGEEEGEEKPETRDKKPEKGKRAGAK